MKVHVQKYLDYMLKDRELSFCHFSVPHTPHSYKNADHKSLIGTTVSVMVAGNTLFLCQEQGITVFGTETLETP